MQKVKMDRLKIHLPVIVEGKYDKNKLSSVIDADIFTTGGFGIFNQKEKLDFFRRISRDGVIVLCDSDGAGTQIRSYISSAVEKDKIFSLYTPQIEGKERRKKQASKEGFLGVEGMDADILRAMFAPFAEGNTPELDRITKLDLYEAGLTGTADSSERRERLAKHLSLPGKLSVNAFLSALNVTLDREGLQRAVGELFGEENEEK